MKNLDLLRRIALTKKIEKRMTKKYCIFYYFSIVYTRDVQKGKKKKKITARKSSSQFDVSFVGN